MFKALMEGLLDILNSQPPNRLTVNRTCQNIKDRNGLHINLSKGKLASKVGLITYLSGFSLHGTDTVNCIKERDCKQCFYLLFHFCHRNVSNHHQFFLAIE